MILPKFACVFLAITIGLLPIAKASGTNVEHSEVKHDEAIGKTYRGLRQQKCPNGSDYTYVSRDDTCHINYLCVNGKEPFKIDGCGCGCRNVKTTSPPKKTCPSGPDYTYIKRSDPCVINFLCVQCKESFSIPGCGCGCKTITSTQPPVVTNTTTGNATCPSGDGVSYFTHDYPCVVNFACVISSPEAFSVPGCGCGCKPSSLGSGGLV